MKKLKIGTGHWLVSTKADSNPQGEMLMDSRVPHNVWIVSPAWLQRMPPSFVNSLQYRALTRLSPLGAYPLHGVWHVWCQASFFGSPTLLVFSQLAYSQWGLRRPGPLVTWPLSTLTFLKAGWRQRTRRSGRTPPPRPPRKEGLCWFSWGLRTS